MAGSLACISQKLYLRTDDCMSDEYLYRNGIELVFLGTKAGLTRYYPLVDNLTDT